MTRGKETQRRLIDDVEAQRRNVFQSINSRREQDNATVCYKKRFLNYFS